MQGAAVSALLMLLSAPPSPFFWLVFFALTPFAIGVRGARRQTHVRAGALLFALHWSLALIWIPQAGLRVGAWTLAAWLAVTLTLTLLGALFGYLLHSLTERARWPLPLALASAWVAVEVMRGSWLGPLSFPWLGLALPLTAMPELIQGASVVGEAGLSFGLALVAGCAALLLPAGSGVTTRRTRWAMALAVTSTLAGVWALGHMRLTRSGLASAGAFVVVQPAVPLIEKRGPAALDRSIEAVDLLLADARAAAVESQARAIVMPETVLEGAAPETLATLQRWRAAIGIDLIAGVPLERETDRGARRSNAVVHVTEQGVEAIRYKVRLVPGVEWVPLEASSWVAGPRLKPALIDGDLRIGALVCIESASVGEALHHARDGADLLVNVTNDAWLAEPPWWTRSAAFAQHPAHLAMRAVETGLGAVRVGNNGWSESVTPLGQRTPIVPALTPGVGVAHVVTMAGRTAFVSAGWLFGWVLPWFTLAVSLIASRKREAGPPIDPASSR